MGWRLPLLKVEEQQTCSYHGEILQEILAKKDGWKTWLLTFHKGNYELSVSKFELRWYWEHDQLDFCGWVSKQLAPVDHERILLETKNTINSNSKVLDEFEMINISAESLIGFVGNNGETYALRSHAVEVGKVGVARDRDSGSRRTCKSDRGLGLAGGKLGGFKLNPFFFSLEAAKLKTSDFIILTLDFF